MWYTQEEQLTGQDAAYRISKGTISYTQWKWCMWTGESANSLEVRVLRGGWSELRLYAGWVVAETYSVYLTQTDAIIVHAELAHIMHSYREIYLGDKTRFITKTDIVNDLVYVYLTSISVRKKLVSNGRRPKHTYQLRSNLAPFQ